MRRETRENAIVIYQKKRIREFRREGKERMRRR
jgi:hypothetical protein